MVWYGILGFNVPLGDSTQYRTFHINIVVCRLMTASQIFDEENSRRYFQIQTILPSLVKKDDHKTRTRSEFNVFIDDFILISIM